MMALLPHLRTLPLILAFAAGTKRRSILSNSSTNPLAAAGEKSYHLQADAGVYQSVPQARDSIRNLSASSTMKQVRDALSNDIQEIRHLLHDGDSLIVENQSRNSTRSFAKAVAFGGSVANLATTQLNPVVAARTALAPPLSTGLRWSLAPRAALTNVTQTHNLQKSVFNANPSPSPKPANSDKEKEEEEEEQEEIDIAVLLGIVGLAVGGCCFCYCCCLHGNNTLKIDEQGRGQDMDELHEVWVLPDPKESTATR